MLMKGIHHVAYRCSDSRKTVEFYTKVLGARFNAAVRGRTRHEDQSEMLHTFFQLEDGSHIAFFELPALESQGWDPHTPRWVQHIAFRVANKEIQAELKQKLEAHGVEVDGPKNGPTCCSIYFEDPSGNRLELAVPHVLDEAKMEKEATAALDLWDKERLAIASGNSH